ncbi:lytic transglycosylase domain-containing protein [Microvirga alba]|uniref:Transglycosylase SLT domain-containing protein n=1 Tax=Microvirga alba TaxID=2791025 RepID=A0A931FSD2_9HYPH|nr:lytic transglycosylase domain-containing protein [Microvirga alba]MBF9233601.1 transglycosylase SLT domain-containing protein [Microvirga alba]
MRTITVAVLGVVALSIVSQASAESGDGASIVEPVSAEIEASESVAVSTGAEAPTDAEEKSGKAVPAKKPTKIATKGGAEKASNPKAAQEQATAPADATQPEPAVEAAIQPGDQDEPVSVEVTSAILPGQDDARFRLKQADVARAGAVRLLIARHASENDVPFALVDAIVRLESRYNPVARRGANVGLTQINVRTAQSLGYQGGASGLLDAETNLRYGVKYLAQAYKLARGDTCGTILRYQFGHRTETMTKASKAYCGKVKTLIAAVN